METTITLKNGYQMNFTGLNGYKSITALRNHIISMIQNECDHTEANIRYGRDFNSNNSRSLIYGKKIKKCVGCKMIINDNK